MNFIGYTIGLPIEGRSVKVQYTRLSSGEVELAAVCGNSLAAFGPKRTITADEFDSRPADPYDSAAEALWALGILGL